MEIYRDFSDLLASFNKNGVEYLIVGGYALAFHGAPRYTGDLDLLVRPTRDNAARVLRALDDFGFGGLDLSAEDFCIPRQVVQLGVPPVRVDLLTSISGVEWEAAQRGARAVSYGSVSAPVIGREALIANKRATDRPRDRADLAALGIDDPDGA